MAGSGFFAEEPFPVFGLLSEVEPLSFDEETALSAEEESAEEPESAEDDAEELSAAAAFSRWRLRVP